MVDYTNYYSVVSTVALVVITGYYAYQTKQLVRKPFTPFISASWTDTDQNINLNITNVGVGTATDVAVRYSVPFLNIAEETMPFASMQPGSSGRLSIPVQRPQTGEQLQVHLMYQYADIFGKRYSRREDLTVRLNRPK